jgi:hypothetical protein
VQDSLKDGDIRLDDGLIVLLDELRQLALVSGRVAEWLSHSRLLVCFEVFLLPIAAVAVGMTLLGFVFHIISSGAA